MTNHHRVGCLDHGHPAGTECDLPASVIPAPQFPPGTPEYAAYRADLARELGKFQRGEDPYPYEVPRHPDGGYVGTVVNGGQEVNLRDMLTEPWMPELAARLERVLGRKYLAHQLVSMLPADVALRLVDRVDEVVEHQVSTAVERIHQDVDGAVALTLARLAESADAKRREISRERFTTPSRLS